MSVPGGVIFTIIIALISFLLPVLLVSILIYKIIKYYINARKEELLILTKEGAIDPESTLLLKRNNFPWLKVGIILICVGLAYLTIFILSQITTVPRGIYLAIISIFSGIGFIIASRIKK